ncbi:DUF1207 domain-containing protein [Lignipirellula cremea]|uniref:DUF1207 domain-containing protein n=1 Tax=Lignipirellula cremea TaxID=2528010 RepID=A0A518E1N7_9BACT|nr:DUF1207 domain-containing protein [Lignipirellula cremea]QDU97983.1 hypothetical protein Pla8534_58420 [Lignipirellula cremea]
MNNLYPLLRTFAAATGHRPLTGNALVLCLLAAAVSLANPASVRAQVERLPAIDAGKLSTGPIPTSVPDDDQPNVARVGYDGYGGSVDDLSGPAYTTAALPANSPPNNRYPATSPQGDPAASQPPSAFAAGGPARFPPVAGPPTAGPSAFDPAAAPPVAGRGGLQAPIPHSPYDSEPIAPLDAAAPAAYLANGGPNASYPRSGAAPAGYSAGGQSTSNYSSGAYADPGAGYPAPGSAVAVHASTGYTNSGYPSSGYPSPQATTGYPSAAGGGAVWSDMQGASASDGQAIEALSPDDMLFQDPDLTLSEYGTAHNTFIAPAYGQPWTLQVLPASIIYKSYLAGAKESRFAAHILHVDDDIHTTNLMWDATLGARVGLLRYGTQGDYFPQGFQVDAEGSAQIRLDIEEEVDVQSADYRGGVPFTYGIGRSQFKFAYYHLSSHLGDEFLLKRPGYDRLNFARDVLQLGYSFYPVDDVRLYAEVGWAFYSEISEPWEFQFGIDYAPYAPTGICGAPFFAANVHLRQEVDFGGNVTVQAGWAWRADQNGRLLRMGLHYLAGKSNHYSFPFSTEQQIGFGLWYDF